MGRNTVDGLFFWQQAAYYLQAKLNDLYVDMD